MTTTETRPYYAEAPSIMLANEIYEASVQYLEQLPALGVVRTELRQVESGTHPLSAAGYDLQIKNEGEQPVGSYKIRGATTAILAAKQRVHDENQFVANPAELQFVDCVTNGNHGASVAFAARQQGLRGALVETRADADPSKIELLDTHGAIVHNHHATFDAARASALKSGRQRGHAFIAPFDAVETMAGQASLAHETIEDLLEQQARGEIDLLRDHITITLPGGGGGLSAACAAIFYRARQEGILGDNVRVLVVQMENCDAIARQRNGQEPLTLETLDSSCDSTAVLQPGKLTMQILMDERMVQEVLSVPKEYVAQAMRFLTSHHDTLVEPAGALSLAGALYLADRQGAAPSNDSLRHSFVTITSGINISYANFAAFHPDATMPPDSMSAAARLEAVQHLNDPQHIFTEAVYRAAQEARTRETSNRRRMSHIVAATAGYTVTATTQSLLTTNVWSSPTTRAYVVPPTSRHQSRPLGSNGTRK